ncbi:MAG: DUF4349 domain-containing protein [Candidatus Moraniibacteriota bacterium]
MAARRFDWQKHVRIGGFLLVFMLFAPVLGIFLMQTISLIPKRVHVSLPSPSNRDMPMIYKGGVMMGQSGTAGASIGGDMMQQGEPDIAPMTMEAVTFPYREATIPVPAAERKIVKGASLDLRAQSLAWTNNRIQEAVKNVGGYIENANISQPKNDIQTAWLEVRVPADRLDVTIEEAKKAASSVISENLNAGDVTDQNIDLTARLNAKRAEESALVSLLNRAEKVSDIIEVTERLSVVRSEIEQLDAQNRRLEGQVAMSQLSISITEDPRVVLDDDAVRDGNVVKQSVTDLTRWAIALMSALAAIAIAGLPVLIIYGFFLWVFYRIGKFIAERVVGQK